MINEISASWDSSVIDDNDTMKKNPIILLEMKYWG